MPVDPWIARGTPGLDITNTLAQIVALRQRDETLRVANDRTRLEERRFDAETQGASEKKQLEHLLAKTEWALKSGNPRQAILSDPGIDPRAAQAFSQMNDDQATQILQQKRAEYASQLGIGPPEDNQPSGAMYKTPGPDGQPYYAGADGQPRFPAYQEPERPQSYQPNEAPADQRLFGWFNQLPPEQQAAFLNMKRANATPEMAGQVAGAKATATEHAKSTAAAQADLPRVETNADDMLQALGTLEKSPGFKYLWGAYSIAPVVPGTPQADAAAVWEQVQGKAFLEAFGTLKGGGQITEKEGEKATAAITRLSNRRQSPESALAAIRELRNIVNAGRARARQKAAQSPAQSSAQPPESQPREVNFEDL